MQKSLTLLKEGGSHPKFYFKSRGAHDSIAGYAAGSGSLQFGGQAFSGKSCQGIWSEFPTSLFFSPKEVVQEKWFPTFSPLSLVPTKQTHTPSFPLWQKQVHDALAHISQNRFQKVVLARQTTLTFTDPLCPYQLLEHLSPLGTSASLFFFQISPENTFLGATPEKLFHRIGATLMSEALAGTKVSEAWTDKEHLENHLVRSFLSQKFNQLCQNSHWHSLENLPFGQLSHLYQKVEGVLNHPISDHDLISAFHPTPALGGFPSDAALSYLHATETFPRGWYGGPLGLLSPDEADIAVSIRSALVQKNHLHLFAGAGIVQSSDATREWEELDRKIAHFMRCFT